MAVTILAGPTGTELIRRGVDCSGPAWSARAIAEAPGVLADIHREYARAGADIHVACTFRTQPRLFPGFTALTAKAVQLARDAIGPGSCLTGSLVPIADCYRPAESPLSAGGLGREIAADLHAAMARALVGAGADLILCEAFPRADEGLLAADCALRAGAGMPVWLSFTPGLEGDLLRTSEVEHAAREALARGVQAVLVNCIAARRALPYVTALARACAGTRTPFGVYANAGPLADGLGWTDDAGEERAAWAYADLAQSWVDAGATIIGSCCGTTPTHTRELVRRFRR